MKGICGLDGDGIKLVAIDEGSERVNIDCIKTDPEEHDFDEQIGIGFTVGPEINNNSRVVGIELSLGWRLNGQKGLNIETAFVVVVTEEQKGGPVQRDVKRDSPAPEVHDAWDEAKQDTLNKR